MDHARFIGVIRGYPQVWDRDSHSFRDTNVKNDTWEQVANALGYPANVCKDTFKSLREKYVREREKQIMFGEKYIPWEHFDSLSFLAPNIISRKQTISYQGAKGEHSGAGPHSEDSQSTENYSDFDRTLISLVRQASPIWDRKCNGYPSKQVKFQLWRGISQSMNKEINVCMMRWKGLREKYIRQKNKYNEGDGKWEFLDDMAFLDRVIQYRRKNGEPDMGSVRRSDPSFQFNNSGQEFYDDNSINDSLSNDFTTVVKNEDYASDHQESFYDSGTSSSGRKRAASDNSECSFEKRDRTEYLSQKSPEVMFGELVAVMLARKPEKDKHVAMIEIMKVLTK